MIWMLLFLAAAGALSLWAVHTYRRAEPVVRGWRALAALRASAYVVLAALVFDLSVPSSVSQEAARWAVLDASLSMSADSGAAWLAARARAEALAARGWTVVGLGAADPLSLRAPTAPETRLAPVLRRALEAGASEVRVLTDGRFFDRVETESLLRTSGLVVDVERFGGGGVNAGVAELSVADAAGPGDTVRVAWVLHGRGEDSVSWVLRAEDEVLLRGREELPAEGRTRRVRLQVPAPRQEGWRRYAVRVELGGDDFSADDEAVTYAVVGHRTGGVVLLSFRPDWEPRFLLPVLEASAGLEGRGFMRVADGRFVTMGRGDGRGPPVEVGRVAREVADAEVVVLHGWPGRSPPPLERALRGAGRLLLWPSDPEGLRVAGLPGGEREGGEWYVSAEVAPSPLAGALAGVPLLGLPPLTAVWTGVPGSGSPLLVQLRGSGRPLPLLHLTEAADGGRTAVVLASGFWRWAARGGDARTAYGRFWAGVVGWLLEGGATRAVEARPLRRVWRPGEPIRFALPEAPADEPAPAYRVRLLEGARVVADTTTDAGNVELSPLPEGIYTYRVERTDPGTAAGATPQPWDGRLEVRTETLEMLPAVAELPAAASASPDLEPAPGPRGLRTHAWPYLLVLGLLCAEWILRRRSGLR